MNGITVAFLVAGVLIVAAGVGVVLTRRARRRAVVWLTPPGSTIAHAFRQVELTNLGAVSPLRHCGTWLVTELREDEHAEQCWPCRRAAEELGERSP
jgi:hypothetical protein